MDYFDLLRERRRLIAERDHKLGEIRQCYQRRISAVNVGLSALKRPSKPKALVKYLETEDAPVRYCESCKEPILRATIQNAEEVAVLASFYSGTTHTLGYFTCKVRRLRQPFCCRVCQQGKGSHSNGCSSATQHAERMEEDGAKIAWRVAENLLKEVSPV